jgi:hypothetical protein
MGERRLLRMRTSKKGLSDVVTTVLIILLVLAAIVIIWSFLRPTLVSTGTTVEAQTKCTTVNLEPTACTVKTATGGAKTTETHVRYVSGDIAKVVLIATDANGKAVSATVAAPSAGATADNTFTGDYTGGKLSGAGVVVGSDGKEYTCPESAVKVDCKA